LIVFPTTHRENLDLELELVLVLVLVLVLDLIRTRMIQKPLLWVEVGGLSLWVIRARIDLWLALVNVSELNGAKREVNPSATASPSHTLS
jgi:hypothetical protein